MSQRTISQPAVPSSTSRTAHPANRQLRNMVLLAAGVTLIATCATTIYFSHYFSGAQANPTPRLDASVEEVARFVADPNFQKLPFENQRRFMELLDDREDELDAAYRAGKLEPTQYRKAMEFGWFGKHLSRMEKYLSLSTPEEKAAYVAERLDRKEEKNRRKGRGDNDGGDNTEKSGGGGGKALPAGLIDVERDEQSEKDIPRTWPPQWRDKWKKYRNALKEERDAREEAAQTAENGAEPS